MNSLYPRGLTVGTIIWTSPEGQRCVTTPGSALIFPDLCVLTCTIAVGPRRKVRRGDRTATMPRRRRTREQNRAAAIAAERHRNLHPRPARSRPVEYFEYADTFTVSREPIPPPF
jgi:hypothetical protein